MVKGLSRLGDLEKFESREKNNSFKPLNLKKKKQFV